MKQIILTNGLVALVDDEDYDLVRARSWNPHRARQRAERYYAYTKLSKNVAVSMHRFLMEPPPGVEVDHINGDGLDNRRGNLRLSTRSQNCANQRRPVGVSGYIGVYREKAKWRAKVGSNSSVGLFDTAVEAAHARDAEAIRRFGDFARLNFPRRR